MQTPHLLNWKLNWKLLIPQVHFSGNALRCCVLSLLICYDNRHSHKEKSDDIMMTNRIIRLNDRQLNYYLFNRIIQTKYKSQRIDDNERMKPERLEKLTKHTDFEKQFGSMLEGSRDIEKDLRNQERRQRLLEACRGNEEIYIGNNTETDVKSRLIVDRTHNFIYCAIEKIGSTFWKRIIQILIGYRKTKNPFDIRGIEAHAHFKTLQKVSFDRIHVLLENSTKFLFVREPYARLLSGYVDKLFSPNSLYWRYVGAYIVRYFRANPTNHSIKCGHDVTFPEFIDYIIDSQNYNRHRNGHFTPSYDHCRPCQIKYDIIGKLETFRNDTLYILHKLGLDSFIHFPDFNKDSEVDALTDAVDNLYAMRHAVMKCMPFKEALLRVWKKMQIRGILSIDIPFPYSPKSSPFISLADFSQSLLDAHARSGPREKRLKNREIALVEAFQQIDPEQLQKLKKILEPDCKIFGYNSEPPQIFKSSQYVKPFFFSFY